MNNSEKKPYRRRTEEEEFLLKKNNIVWNHTFGYVFADTIVAECEGKGCSLNDVIEILDGNFIKSSWANHNGEE